MSPMNTVTRVWIGFGIATLVALVLGGLAALAAANGATGWAAAAVAAGAVLVAGAGAWVASSVRGSVAAMTTDAERAGAAAERLSSSVRAATDRLSALSRGELPAPLADREAPELGRALDAAVSAVGGLLDGLQALSAAAAREGAELRVPEDRLAGRFQEALRAQQRSFEELLRRAQSLEQILDAVPLPLTASDRDGRTRFVNAAAEQLLGEGRAALLGRPADRDRLAAAARQRGRQLAVETAELRPVRGGPAGQVEVGHDQTALMRMAEYSVTEMTRLARALEQLGAGNLTVDLNVAEGGEHTADRRKQLLLFAQGIGRVRDAIAGLVRDSTRLAEAVVAGRLSERIDSKGHLGDFRKVVEGMNHTLDAVLAPVDEAAQVLDQLSRRDLRARVTSAYGGDHARIKQSVNSAAEALHEALSHVWDAVEQVSSASGQIASSSQAVASGASEQAASLEQTSSSIETVASMTRQSADNAQQANHLAEAARGAAGQGIAAVEQMQSAMSRIKASAEGTSQIIRDINDIAFQTNLLALNAAVEAARAGEAGRGFAVVAEEVRSLALRAKEAAMKTEELIRQSVKEAGQGEVTAKQVAGKLSEIAGGISKVNEIISEIAAGARAQATGIDQVNRAVAEMDRVVQQNAASAEESSSAAIELSGQAEELASMVGSFHLERSAARKAAPPRLPAAVAPAPAAAFAPRNGTPAPASPVRDADKVFPMDDPDDLKDF
jgi:methyl-accepting chemotaxis protein